MWKPRVCLTPFLAVVLTASACGGNSSKIQARPNKEFPLPMGQRASIVGENLEIKFENVMEDSLCPTGATCVCTGMVTCTVELRQTGASCCMALTEPGLTAEYSKETHGKYELGLCVTPYPGVGKRIPTDAYRLHLIISKLPRLTDVLGSVIGEPVSFEGRNTRVASYYRGWLL